VQWRPSFEAYTNPWNFLNLRFLFTLRLFFQLTILEAEVRQLRDTRAISFPSLDTYCAIVCQFMIPDFDWILFFSICSHNDSVEKFYEIKIIAINFECFKAVKMHNFMCCEFGCCCPLWRHKILTDTTDKNGSLFGLIRGRTRGWAAVACRCGGWRGGDSRRNKPPEGRVGYGRGTLLLMGGNLIPPAQCFESFVMYSKCYFFHSKTGISTVQCSTFDTNISCFFCSLTSHGIRKKTHHIKRTMCSAKILRQNSLSFSLNQNLLL